MISLQELGREQRNIDRNVINDCSDHMFQDEEQLTDWKGDPIEGDYWEVYQYSTVNIPDLVADNDKEILYWLDRHGYNDEDVYFKYFVDDYGSDDIGTITKQLIQSDPVSDVEFFKEYCNVKFVEAD